LIYLRFDLKVKKILKRILSNPVFWWKQFFGSKIWIDPNLRNWVVSILRNPEIYSPSFQRGKKEKGKDDRGQISTRRHGREGGKEDWDGGEEGGGNTRPLLTLDVDPKIMAEQRTLAVDVISHGAPA
jgi:hypothetical protein